MLEAGDWIYKINGSSTTDKGRPLLNKVTSKRNIQSLDVRKPLEQQTFNLWDEKQETLEFKAKEKELPFTLHIFHPVSLLLQIYMYYSGCIDCRDNLYIYIYYKLYIYIYTYKFFS